MQSLETSSHILQLFPVPVTPYYALVDRKRPTDYVIQLVTAALASSLVADSGDDDPEIRISFDHTPIGEVSSSTPSQLADFLFYWKMAASSIPNYDDSLSPKYSFLDGASTLSASQIAQTNAADPSQADDAEGFNIEITKPQSPAELRSNLIKNITPLKPDFVYNKELKIRCVTWNLHAEPLHKANIKSLLGLEKQSEESPFDLYFIAIQESDQLGPKNWYANQNTLHSTKEYITATLGGPSKFQIVVQNQLLGILSLVVCSTDLIPHLSDFYHNTTGTGLFGIWGNKGAALISFFVGQDLTVGEIGTKVTILNCHLTHGEGLQGTERRRWELGEIQKKLQVEGLVGKRRPITVFSANNKETDDEPDHEIDLIDYTEDDQEESEEQKKAKNFGKVDRKLSFPSVEDKKEKPKDDSDEEKEDDIIISEDDEDEDEDEEEKETKPEKTDSEHEPVPNETDSEKPKPGEQEPISPSFPDTSNPPGPSGSSNRNLIFVLGDMNYRVSLEPNTIVDLVEQEDFATILSADKLSLEHKEKKIFPLYSEGEINFSPTYKYAVGTDDFDDSKVYGSSGSKARAPSYTDRIFYRAVDSSDASPTFSSPKNSGGEDNTSVSTSSASLLFPPLPSDFCKLTNYTSLMEYTLSDHKPVVADFAVNLPLIDFENRKQAVQRVLKAADDQENSSKPTVLVEPREVIVKDAVVMKEAEATIQVEYKLNTNIPNKVLQWEISLAPEVLSNDEVIDDQLQAFQEEEQKTKQDEAPVPIRIDSKDDEEDEDSVVLTSVLPVPSKVASRTVALSHIPNTHIPITIYPRSGMLPPGGKQHIKFKCTLPVFRGRTSSVVRVAVLRIVDAQDMFIPIEFAAQSTSLGASLNALSRYKKGARNGNQDMLLEESAANMPKEIWSCADYLWQHIDQIYSTKGYKDVGKAKPDSTELDLYVPPDYDQLNSSQLFFEVATQKAEPSLQFEIQEWLDTGSDFDTVLLRAANEMADPEASAYIQNYESVLNTSANASTGGWRLSKNKIDENSLFIQSQLKYITANSRSVPPTATEVKDGDAEYVRSTLLPTDKSFVGVYSVASQFLLLLKNLDGSIIPAEYYPIVSTGREGSILILEKLPRVNVNVLLYIMSFLKLIVDKEEEMVATREAKERKVKRILRAQEVERVQSSKKEELDIMETTLFEVPDFYSESPSPTKEAIRSAQQSVTSLSLVPTTTTETIGTLGTSESLSSKSSRRNSSFSFSRLGSAFEVVGAEFNAGFNRSVDAVRKGGKELGSTLTTVGTTVATGVVTAGSTVGSVITNNNSQSPKSTFAASAPTPAFNPKSQSSSSSSSSEEEEDKFILNQQRVLDRAKALLVFMDEYIIEKPQKNFKETKATKTARLEFMLELLGL